MDNLDYLNENSLRSFPLVDEADTSLYNGSLFVGTLPMGVLLDAQFNILDISQVTTPLRFYLASIFIDGVFKLNIGGSATYSITIPTSGVTTVSVSNSHGQAALTVDGTCFANWVIATGLAPGSYTFTSQPAFCVSCLLLQPSMVTQLTLLNNTGCSSSDIAFSQTYTAGETVALTQGTNLDYSTNDNSLTLSVLAGSGAGLFDGCPAPTNAINYINNSSPDTNGNLILQTDGCIRLTPYLSEHAIGIHDGCQPTCSSVNVLDMAYYLNRMIYRKNELNALLTTAGDSYNSAISAYNTCEATTVATAPYFKATDTTLSNLVTTYDNVTCGIYSNNLSDISTVITVSAGSALTLVDDRSYIMQNDFKRSITLATFSGATQVLAPNSVSFLGLVYTQPLSTSANTGSTTQDVTFQAAAGSYPNTLYSGYVMPLNPRSTNFHAAYSTQISGSYKFVTITIDPIAAAADYPPSSATISVGGISAFTVVDATMTQDNGTPQDLLTTPTWTGILDFSKVNQFQLVMKVLTGGASAYYNVTLSISGGFGAATKILQVNL